MYENFMKDFTINLVVSKSFVKKKKKTKTESK